MNKSLLIYTTCSDNIDEQNEVVPMHLLYIIV